MLYPSVRAAFHKLTVDREGATDWMYADSKNFVTTGLGNKIDDSQTEHSVAFQPSDYRPALRFPWRHGKTGPLASGQEIAAAWQLVKSHIELNPRGGGIYASLPGNDLRLDSATVDAMVQEQYDVNAYNLAQLYPRLAFLPADAQLGLVSMAWAMGTERMRQSFPKFNAAINASPPDFVTAARESHMRDASASRNDADRDLFLNAAAVQAGGLDPSVVHWPATVTQAAKVAGAAGAGIAGLGLAVGLGTLAYYLLKWKA